LAARVGEAVVIAFAGEVEPFGVAELVTFEVEVALAAETVGDESDHLVEGETAVDNRCQFGEVGHVCVHFGVAEPEEKSLVSHQPMTISTCTYVASEWYLRLVVTFRIRNGLLAVSSVGQCED
jgi:hypothetical protein